MFPISASQVRNRRKFHFLEGLLCGVCVITLFPLTTVADTIPAIVEVSEIMGHVYGSEIVTITQIFGPDYTSSVTVNTFVDPAAKTFSYSTAPGSLYQGLPLQTDVSGSFDGSMWTWNTSGALGANLWNATGTANLDPVNVAMTMAGIWDWCIPDGSSIMMIPIDLDNVTTIIRFDTGTGHVESDGTLEFTLGGGTTAVRVKDEKNAGNPWTYDFLAQNPPLESPWYAVAVQGDWPYPQGGRGQLVAINTTPEPSNFVLLSTGLTVVCLYSVVRKRHLKQSMLP